MIGLFQLAALSVFSKASTGQAHDVEQTAGKRLGKHPSSTRKLIRHEAGSASMSEVNMTSHSIHVQGSTSAADGDVGEEFVFKFSQLKGTEFYMKFDPQTHIASLHGAGTNGRIYHDEGLYWYRQNGLHLEVRARNACDGNPDGEYGCCVMANGAIDAFITAAPCRTSCANGACEWCRLVDCTSAVVYVAKNRKTCPTCADITTLKENSALDRTLCLSGKAETKDARMDECSDVMGVGGYQDDTARVEELDSESGQTELKGNTFWQTYTGGQFAKDKFGRFHHEVTDYSPELLKLREDKAIGKH